MERHNEHVAIILGNIKKRQKIELGMIQVIREMDESMGEVEALLLEAFNGRERDMMAAMG